MSAKKSKRASFRIALPATSANLGPAFDAAALAMDFYITIGAQTAKEFSIIATGRDAEICGKLEEHLILDTYRDVLRSAGKAITPLALEIDNDIPIGKGCGSSAAARLAGIALAMHFGKLRWSDAQIVGEASRLEHHPDNASACWMGGLTIARMATGRESGSKSRTNELFGRESQEKGGEFQKNEAQVVSIRPRGKWPLLLAVPEQALSTEAARRVLPAQYSRAYAVANIQNSMLLLAAFTQERHDLLSSALEDRIHEPYRAVLCPLLPCLQQLQGRDGILGAVLSGAGPSVLMFIHPRASAAKVRRVVVEHLAKNRLAAELIPTSIATRGARLR
jgi:homoserine kinase